LALSFCMFLVISFSSFSSSHSLRSKSTRNFSSSLSNCPFADKINKIIEWEKMREREKVGAKNTHIPIQCGLFAQLLGYLITPFALLNILIHVSVVSVRQSRVLNDLMYCFLLFFRIALSTFSRLFLLKQN